MALFHWVSDHRFGSKTYQPLYPAYPVPSCPGGLSPGAPEHSFFCMNCLQLQPPQFPKPSGFQKGTDEHHHRGKSQESPSTGCWPFPWIIMATLLRRWDSMIIPIRQMLRLNLITAKSLRWDLNPGMVFLSS